MLCALILYISGGIYSLKSTPNDRFFEKLFMAIFIWLSEFLPEICWEQIAEEILFVFRLFWCLTWDSNLGFSSNKPTHYLLDHGDLNVDGKTQNLVQCCTTLANEIIVCVFYCKSNANLAQRNNNLNIRKSMTAFQSCLAIRINPKDVEPP